MNAQNICSTQSLYFLYFLEQTFFLTTNHQQEDFKSQKK